MGLANTHPFANFPGKPSYYTAFYDFDNENNVDAFTGTALASGTGAVTLDQRFGVYRLANNASDDNSGFQIQGDMETASLVAGKKTWFITRVALSEATQSELYAGLSITDTTIIDGGGTLAIADLTPSDQVGFYKPDGQATVYGTITRDSVLISTGPFTAFADATYVELGFLVEMDSATAGKGHVTFFVNGLAVGSLDSTTMPYDSEEILTPSVAFCSGTGSAQTCDIDYVGVMQER